MSSTFRDRRNGISPNAQFKIPVVAATDAEITLSGLQTIDGVVLKSGDRVLVKDQSDAKQNGVYIADTGTWTRPSDFNDNLDIISGSIIPTVGGGLWYELYADGEITVGQTELTFQVVNTSVTTQSITEAVANSETAIALALILS